MIKKYTESSFFEVHELSYFNFVGLSYKDGVSVKYYVTKKKKRGGDFLLELFSFRASSDWLGNETVVNDYFCLCF